MTKKKKNTNEVFCRTCGKVIHKEAEICPCCGVRQVVSEKGKNKTTAVLLAIFLAPFNWLYTYKKDAVKFWIGLIFEIFAWLTFETHFVLIAIFINIIAIIDSSTKSHGWYKDF